MPNSRTIQLAGFIFAVGLSVKVRSVHHWHFLKTVQTSLHYKNDRPSDILIYQQNSHALHSKQCSRYEKKSVELDNKKLGKKNLYITIKLKAEENILHGCHLPISMQTS
jgi:hypothetical protein